MQKDKSPDPGNGYVEFILRNRIQVLALIGLLTCAAAYFATRVEFNNSIEMWFLEGDTQLQIYDTFTDQFGGDEVAIIGLTARNVFSRMYLESESFFFLAVHGIQDWTFVTPKP